MKLTQSAVKDWTDTTCPRRWQSFWIEGQKPRANEPQMEGLVFETLCIGASADGSQYTELPRLANGSKSVKQLRIEEQASRFKDMFDPEHPDFLGFTLVDKQIVLETKDRKGTLDIIATDTDGDVCIIDLKWTQSIPQGYWADLNKIDFLQQIHYQWLYEQNYGVTPDMYVLIFDGTPQKNKKLIKVVPSPITISKAINRFDQVDMIIDEYLQYDNFPAIGNHSECARCLVHDCAERKLKPIVEYEEIYI